MSVLFPVVLPFSGGIASYWQHCRLSGGIAVNSWSIL